MMKLNMKQRRRQKGATLILALIVLVLASLVITGLLHYVSTSVIAHGKAVNQMEARYAADAGIEWFAAELLTQNDTNRFDGDDELDDLWAEASVGTVNGKTPQVIIREDGYTPFGSASHRYIIDSTVDNVTIAAEVTQADVGGENSVVVSHWEM